MTFVTFLLTETKRDIYYESVAYQLKYSVYAPLSLWVKQNKP